MKNTTMELTSVYQAALEYLAESRGFSGAEELVERTAAVDPDFTPRELLQAPPGGFGPALGAALGGMTEAEKMLITKAFARTFVGLKRSAPEMVPLDQDQPDWRDVPRSEMFSRAITAVDAAKGEAVEEGDHSYVRYCDEQLFPFLSQEKDRAEVLELLKEAEAASGE